MKVKGLGLSVLMIILDLIRFEYQYMVISGIYLLTRIVMIDSRANAIALETFRDSKRVQLLRNCSNLILLSAL